MKNLVVLIIFAIAFCTCGNQQRHPSDSIVSNELPFVEQTESDTVDASFKEEKPKTNKESSPAINSSSSVHSQRSNYDNMRGFDPASEDDMDDNGMSRYMENYDDEGWD